MQDHARLSFETAAPTGFRIAVKSDADSVADILSAAFRDDPIMLWTFGNPKGIGRAMRIFFLSVYLRQGLVHIEKQALGVSMWLLPGRPRKLPGPAALRYAITLAPVAGLSPIYRGASFADALTNVRGHRLALYLFALGIRPEAQGRGLGSTMIASGLELASHLGVPVELETSKPANIAYYENHGFRVRSEIKAGKGAPMVWSMEANLS